MPSSLISCPFLHENPSHAGLPSSNPTTPKIICTTIHLPYLQKWWFSFVLRCSNLSLLHMILVIWCASMTRIICSLLRRSTLLCTVVIWSILCWVLHNDLSTDTKHSFQKDKFIDDRRAREVDQVFLRLRVLWSSARNLSLWYWYDVSIKCRVILVQWLACRIVIFLTTNVDDALLSDTMFETHSQNISYRCATSLVQVKQKCTDLLLDEVPLFLHSAADTKQWLVWRLHCFVACHTIIIDFD